jgi:hypothetical protein
MYGHMNVKIIGNIVKKALHDSINLRDTCTHAHTNTHAHARTHKHTHTHTRS